MSRTKNRKWGLFKPAKHKWLADIITFKSPRSARKAARRLVNALKRKRLGKLKIGRKRALTISKALQYAGSRAEASSKRSNLSRDEKRELKKISEIYDKAADRAYKLYHSKYVRKRR